MGEAEVADFQVSNLCPAGARLDARMASVRVCLGGGGGGGGGGEAEAEAEAEAVMVRKQRKRRRRR